VHGGFAGFTGFTVGPINNVHAYIPIRRAVQHLHQVKPGARGNNASPFSNTHQSAASV